LELKEMQTISGFRRTQQYTFLFSLYYDQQIHDYFTNYHTATCFDTIVLSSGSL